MRIHWDATCLNLKVFVVDMYSDGDMEMVYFLFLFHKNHHPFLVYLCVSISKHQQADATESLGFAFRWLVQRLVYRCPNMGTHCYALCLFLLEFCGGHGWVKHEWVVVFFPGQNYIVDDVASIIRLSVNLLPDWAGHVALSYIGDTLCWAKRFGMEVSATKTGKGRWLGINLV